MSVDRNAANSFRLRRNQQRTRAGDTTSSVKIVAPLQLQTSGIGLNLASSGGLQISSSQLGIKLQASKGLALAAGGLAVANDGTTIGFNGSGQVANILLTTKGDLYGFAAAPARITVGTDGQFLMANSGNANGVSYQNGVEVLLAASDGANTVTQTTLTSFGRSVVLPANYLTVNRQLRVTTYGIYNALDATQSANIVAILNPGIIGDGLPITSPATGGVARWYLQLNFNVVSTGVSGKVNVGGFAYFESSTGVKIVVLGQTAITIDTTASKTLDIQGDWTTANASNVLTMRGVTMERLA